MKAKKLALLLGVVMLAALLVVGCAVEEEPVTPPASEEPAEVTTPVEAVATYVGSDSCATCHSQAYEGWQGTEHPYMIQTADNMWLESKAALEELLAAGDSDFLNIGGTDDKLQSMDEIVYIVGHWNKQRFVVKTDDGFRFVQTQYYPEGNQGSQLYGYTELRVYEDRCLACHSTGFDLDAANSLDRTAAEYSLESITAELGVGCEACHGPASDHISAPSKDNIANPANFTVAEQNDACGSCHARNSGHVEIAGRNDAYGFQLGDNLRDFVKPQSIVNAENVWQKVEAGEVQGYYQDEAGDTLRWWADATARSHRMQYNDFESSMKFNMMSCSTCHDPHDASSLKGGSWEGLIALDLGSNTCANCHADIADWDLDEAMPKNAQSQNVKDIRVHTFGSAKPSADIPETK